jgi:biopolymer transport protein ExbD
MNLQVKRKRARIEIVPMIDVMFFLLIFFMLFSTLKSAQTGVPVELPKTLHLGNTEQNTIVISIDKDINLFYGMQQVTQEELNLRVARELEKDTLTRVVIKPDASVSYSVLIKVMDGLAAVGVDRPLLGVDREQMPK